jgi:hypothetical protein
MRGLRDRSKTDRKLQHYSAVKPFPAFVIAASLGAGCVDVPTTPARQADLSADYAAFDHPTASVPEASVPAIVNAFASSGNLATDLGAFGLVPKLVSDSNQALANQAGLLDQFTVDGTAVARLPCTGGTVQALDPSATIVGGEPGANELTFNIGVEDSKVQRTLRGSAQNCELVVPGSSGVPVVSTGSADLTVDLGEDLALGAELTLPVLIQATNVSVDSESTASTPANGYEVRVTADGSVQVLVQPSTFGVPISGTVVVTLFADGHIGVHDQRGTWTCTRNGTSCAFTPST